jgi:hypothetical protein
VIKRRKVAKKTTAKRRVKRAISAKTEASKIPFIRQLRRTNAGASQILIDSYVFGSSIGSR